MAMADSDFEITVATAAGKEYLEHNIKFYSGIMGIIALASGIGSMT